MRSEDRNIHATNYPALHYPELYLLEGGYKALFEYSTVRFCCFFYPSFSFVLK